ncbi:MAG: exodeoxyribonuclease VII small subunit [Bacteroidales bacterium]|nr:exodeoxyribonuclease VII small subunit [Bacteroidales bacterium]
MSKQMDYTEAFHELQQIVSEIEKGEITVDELSAKVKRASELIRICRKKLTTTESDVSRILAELDGSGIESEEQ